MASSSSVGAVPPSPRLVPVPKWCQVESLPRPGVRTRSFNQDESDRLQENIREQLTPWLQWRTLLNLTPSVSFGGSDAEQGALRGSLETEDMLGPVGPLFHVPEEDEELDCLASDHPNSFPSQALEPSFSRLDYHEGELDLAWPALKQLAANKSNSGSRNNPQQADQELTIRRQRDPRIQHARELAVAGFGLSGYATVMIKHIPYTYSQKKFLREINKDGFRGGFDFLYLPSDARSSRGFGFVNLLSARLAEQFYRKYHGQKLKHGDAPVALVVVPADTQGFEESAACFFSSWQFKKGRSNFAPLFLKPVPPHLVTRERCRGK